MCKEEYADLCYLLGKYRYCLAESAMKNENLQKMYDDLSEKINDILNFIIIDNEKD